MKIVVHWETEKIIVPNPHNILLREGDRIINDDYIYTVGQSYVNFDTSTIEVYPKKVRIINAQEENKS